MYRTQAIIPSPRWGATRWRKLFVRVARVFFDLRQKYSRQRAVNKYHRELRNWYSKADYYHQVIEGMPITSTGGTDWRRLPIPPMPLPPPIEISE